VGIFNTDVASPYDYDAPWQFFKEEPLRCFWSVRSGCRGPAAQRPIVKQQEHKGETDQNLPADVRKAVIKDIANERIITANNDKIISEKELVEIPFEYDGVDPFIIKTSNGMNIVGIASLPPLRFMRTGSQGISLCDFLDTFVVEVLR